MSNREITAIDISSPIWRLRLANLENNEAGEIAPRSIIVGGFALLALTATMWITSTAAGSSADTANCITSVEVGCSDRNARVADAARQDTTGGSIGSFGSQPGSLGRNDAVENANNKVSKEDLPGALSTIDRVMALDMNSRPYSQDWLFYDSNNVYSNPDATRAEMVAALRRQINNSERNVVNLRYPFVSNQEINKIEELLNHAGKNTVYSRTDSKGNVYKYSVTDLMRDHASVSKQNQAIAEARALVERSDGMTAAQFKTAFGDLQKKYLVIGGEAGIWKNARDSLKTFGDGL